MTPDVAKQLGVEAGSGVLVRGVQGGSPADNAGVRAGDVVREANRKRVTSVEDFRNIVEKAKDTVLLLVRRDGASVFIAVKLS